MARLKWEQDAQSSEPSQIELTIDHQFHFKAVLKRTESKGSQTDVFPSCSYKHHSQYSGENKPKLLEAMDL